jgi:hypothetical protein
MEIASFTTGVMGTLGRKIRYAFPKFIDEALKITITVNNAELQERRDEEFYLDREAWGPDLADRHT